VIVGIALQVDPPFREGWRLWGSSLPRLAVRTDSLTGETVVKGHNCYGLATPNGLSLRDTQRRLLATPTHRVAMTSSARDARHRAGMA